MASLKSLRLMAALMGFALALLVTALEPAAAQSPTIEHTSPALAHVGTGMTIQARVTDDGLVTSVDLHYRGVTDSSFFRTSMSPAGGAYGAGDPDAYEALIPAQQGPGQIAYYIVASDNEGNMARSPTSGEYAVSVSATPAPLTIDPLLLVYIIASVAIVAFVAALLVLNRGRTRTSPPPR